VAKIRIFLGTMPLLLASIIDDLLSPEDDLDVVGRSAGDPDALAAARACSADILVMADAAPADPRHAIEQIFGGPPLNILAIGGDGRSGHIYRVAREPVALEEAGGLVEAIRRAARGVEDSG
jgi:hypothetical protein